MLATTIHKSNTTTHHQDGATTTKPQTSTGLGETTPGVASGPNSVFSRIAVLKKTICCCAPDPHPLQVKGPSIESSGNPVIRTMRAGPNLVVLLRKEVIQPHLPVRLPCYDFVPIADPTFDSSPHKG